MAVIEMLRNRIDLTNIPFTDRGSRLLLFRRENTLFVRLVERWMKWEQEVGHYRQRIPIIVDFAFLDGNDKGLEFEAETYPHFVRINTEQGDYDWIFEDPETLLVRLPPGRSCFQFTVFADTAQTDRRGGYLHGKRNVAYTTNARIVKNEVDHLTGTQHHIKITFDATYGDSFLLNITPRLGFNRSMPDPAIVFQEARLRWEEWFNAVPPVLEIYQAQYYYAWWIMRAGLLTQRYFFTREALAPSKVHYVGVWQWDQFFHAIAYRHVETKLAEDQLRILIDHQRSDGMFPDAIHDEGLITHLVKPVDADVTKPPLIAWTVLKLFEKSGHLDFLYEMYEPLVRWHNWWMNDNRAENGLCEYHHPFSSGLDDSPLWDYGMPVVSPDLNTYLYIQYESLAKIATLIGEQADAVKFREDAQVLAQRMISFLWDAEKGYFNATHQGNPIPVFTPFHLLPVWINELPSSIVERLLEHLTDPAAFWTPFPIPTVAISDATFDPWQMWRGPTWANINYLFIDALQRIGRMSLARELRLKTLNLIMQHRDIYEYYHPLTAEHPPKAAPIFGWTAAVFIDLAIQETEWQKNRQDAAQTGSFE